MFVINSDWKSARGQVYNIDLDRPRPQMNFNVRPWQLLFNDLCTAHDFPHFTQEKFAVCLPRQPGPDSAFKLQEYILRDVRANISIMINK